MKTGDYAEKMVQEELLSEVLLGVADIFLIVVNHMVWDDQKSIAEIGNKIKEAERQGSPKQAIVVHNLRDIDAPNFPQFYREHFLKWYPGGDSGMIIEGNPDTGQAVVLVLPTCL